MKPKFPLDRAALVSAALATLLVGCGMGSGGSKGYLSLPIPSQVLQSRAVAAIQYDRVILELMAETVELLQDLAAGYQGLPPYTPPGPGQPLGRFFVRDNTLGIPETIPDDRIVTVAGNLALARPKEQSEVSDQTLELTFKSPVQCLVNACFFQLIPMSGTAKLRITAPQVTRASRGEISGPDYWSSPLKFPPLEIDLEFKGSGNQFRATATLKLRLPTGEEEKNKQAQARTVWNVVLIDTEEGLAPAVYLTGTYQLELRGRAECEKQGTVQESLRLTIEQATFSPDTFTVEDLLHLRPVRLDGTRTIDLAAPARPVVRETTVTALIAGSKDPVMEGKLDSEGNFFIRDRNAPNMENMFKIADENYKQRPQPPQNFLAVRRGTVVELSWSASPEATHGYILQYRDSPADPWSTLSTANTTYYLDGSVSLSIDREYRLFVVRGSFDGLLEGDEFKDIRNLSRPAIARPAAFSEPGNIIYSR